MSLEKDAVDPTPSELPRSRPGWLGVLGVVVTLASLLGPLSASGIWDPHELKIADLARRIALNLLGAHGLELEGAVNTVPTLGELGRGQLPFTSIAVGFRLFGLHEWAGRLPLAIWGLFGILATYALLSRLANRVAGAFAALVLATMPLYFLHARTILGDIVTMSALAIAASGLGIACFDRARPGESASLRRSRRVRWLLVGLLGLAAGFGARGVLIGIVVPALGIGLTWLAVRSKPAPDGLSQFVGVLSLAIGIIGGIVGARAVLHALEHTTEFSMLVGSSINKERVLPTFDSVVHQLGHALFPWSAVVPFAIGRMLAAPPGVDADELETQAPLRALLLITAVLGFGVQGLLAPVIGNLPFSAVFALAAMTALALDDFDRGAPGSRTVAMGVVAFAVLLYFDFTTMPEKGLSAFAVNEAHFPDSFKAAAARYMKYGTLAFSGLFLLSFMESGSDAERRFDKDEYLAWLRKLRSVYGGNLLFAVLVGEAALAGFAALTFASDRWLHLRQFQVMAAMPRLVSQVGYLVVPGLVAAPIIALLVRDVFRSFFSTGFGLAKLGGKIKVAAERSALARVHPSRAVVALLAATGFGLALSLGYYPALAAQISPKEVFEAYQRHAKSGEALGMMGVGAGSASYYAGRDVPTFSNVAAAFAWLMEGSDRRWLVIRESDLPQMNSMYRARVTPPDNLPVLDARSSEILLVSNRLERGEKSHNPYQAWILTNPPNPSRKVDGNFGGQLDAIGWDVRTPDGQIVDSVVPGKPYDFVIYYKVVASISGTWETFIHIDGYQRRFNADHKTLDNKYPFHLWRVGDYMADVTTFTLEPNFTPGEYHVFYGLFMGDRRLDVKRGAQNENRLEAGTLHVR